MTVPRLTGLRTDTPAGHTPQRAGTRTDPKATREKHQGGQCSKVSLKTRMAAALLAGSAILPRRRTYTLRATANSNENDEDYDGLVVFKNYVERPRTARIAVELFIGTQLCSNGTECLQGIADGTIDIYISTSGGHGGHLPLCAGARPALPDGR